MIDTTVERRRPAGALTRRWPTALAIGLAALGTGDLAGAVGAFGQILLFLPLLYLIVNQLGRPRATWPVLAAGSAVIIALRVLDVVSPTVVLVAVALALLVWGAVRGTPHGRTAFGIQAAGMLVFGALALAGLAVDPDLGRYVVAAGWLGHGVWDFVHLKLDRTVSRTFAEWCGVTDVLVAVQLAFLL